MKTIPDPMDLTVAHIRRALASLRTQWSKHSPVNPIYLSQELEGGIIMSTFCFNFVINHHSKRMNLLQKKIELSAENQ